MWGARQGSREKMKIRKRSKGKEEGTYVFHFLCDVHYLVFHSMLCIFGCGHSMFPCLAICECI